MKTGLSSFIITLVQSEYLFFLSLFKDILTKGSENFLSIFGKSMHLSTNILAYLLWFIKGGCEGKTIIGSFMTKVNLIPSISFSPILSKLHLILLTSFANLNFPFFSLQYKIISKISCWYGLKNKMKVSIKNLSVVTLDNCPLYASAVLTS